MAPIHDQILNKSLLPFPKVEKEHLLIRMIEAIRIMTLGSIWRAIDLLAARQGLSVAQLARQAGLDRTTFAKSKRRRDGLTLLRMAYRAFCRRRIPIGRTSNPCCRATMNV